VLISASKWLQYDMSSIEHDLPTCDFNFQERFQKKLHQPNHRRLMKHQL
jgi:hypothetical protein